MLTKSPYKIVFMGLTTGATDHIFMVSGSFMPLSFIGKLSLVSQRFSQTWFYVWFPNHWLLSFLFSLRFSVGKLSTFRFSVRLAAVRALRKNCARSGIPSEF